MKELVLEQQTFGHEIRQSVFIEYSRAIPTVAEPQIETALRVRRVDRVEAKVVVFQKEAFNNGSHTFALLDRS